MEKLFVALIMLLSIVYSFFFQRGYGYITSVMLLIISIVYLMFYSSNLLLKNKYVKIFLTFISVTIISSINYIYFERFNVFYFGYLSNSLVIFVLYIVFYLYRLRNPNDFLLKIFVLAYFSCSIAYFYSNYKVYQFINDGNSQFNAFYYAINTFPIIMYVFRNKYFLFIAYMVTLLIAIYSLKRSAILIMIFWLLIFILKNSNVKALFRNIIILVLGGYIIMSFIDTERIDRVFLRLSNVKDDGGSGRDELFIKYLNEVQTFNFVECIFGRGFNAIDDADEGSGYHTFHNDVSEVSFSFGILGLILLVLFYLNLVIDVKIRGFDLSYGFFLINIFLFACVSSVFHYQFYMIMLFIYLGIYKSDKDYCCKTNYK